jgi:hypothetical protein
MMEQMMERLLVKMDSFEGEMKTGHEEMMTHIGSLTSWMDVYQATTESNQK